VTALGAVYDRGYRPYEGDRGGRAATRWALWRLTVRRALGLRRSWRQKVLPWSLLGLATIPAAIDLGIRYATRNTPLAEVDYEFLTFRDYVGVSNILLLFVAVTAPDVARTVTTGSCRCSSPAR
jgi:ABC-2 type transport system permease protein